MRLRSLAIAVHVVGSSATRCLLLVRTMIIGFRDYVRVCFRAVLSFLQLVTCINLFYCTTEAHEHIQVCDPATESVSRVTHCFASPWLGFMLTATRLLARRSRSVRTVAHEPQFFICRVVLL